MYIWLRCIKELEFYKVHITYAMYVAYAAGVHVHYKFAKYVVNKVYYNKLFALILKNN